MDQLIALSRIDDNPFQTRAGYDKSGIAELAADIKARGLLQAPVGRLVLDGKPLDAALYGGVLPALGDEPAARVQLAFGHRRLRAYQLLAAAATNGTEKRWTALPVNVQLLNDEQMALYAWSENSQRKDITAIEEATAIQRMMAQFGWGQAEIGTRLGVDRSTVANKLRLLRLPAEIQDQLTQRKLSERQAMALAPLYELPKSALTRLEKSYSHPRPSDVIEQAPERASDRLREDVERILVNATHSLYDLPWTSVAFDEQGLKANVCEGCKERMFFEKAPRCPQATCYERKAALWAARRLAAASAAMNIQIVPDQLKYNEFDTLVNVPHPEQVIAKHCSNLRLRYTGDDRNAVTRVRLAEFPDVEVICLHGKDGKCTCGRAAKAAATKADPDIQAQKAEEKRIKAELVEPARAAVLDALASGNLSVWRMLALTVSYGVHLPDDADLATLRAAVAKGLVERNVYLPSLANFGQVQQSYEARLSELGLTAPWAVTPEKDLDRRVERSERWVRDEGWWQWEYEINLAAIAGNQVNLERLAAEAATLGAAAGNLPERIAILQGLLAVLEPVGREINELWRTKGVDAGYARPLTHWLLTKEPGGLEFTEGLRKAQAAHVRYALCFDCDLERCIALTERLAELEPAPTESLAELLPL